MNHGKINSVKEQQKKDSKMQQKQRNSAKSDPKRAFTSVETSLYEEARKAKVLIAGQRAAETAIRTYILKTTVNRIVVQQNNNSLYDLYINQEYKGLYSKKGLLDEVKSTWNLTTI